MEASKQTGSVTADSTQHKKHLHLFNKLYDQRITTKINQLINRVRLIETPSIVISARSGSIWCRLHFEFGLQYPFQPLAFGLNIATI